MTHRAAWILALVAAGGAAWFWPTDTRRIVAASRELASAVTIPVGEPDLARVARAAALTRLLAQDARVVAADGRTLVDGRDAAVALATRLRPPRGLDVAIDGIEVVVGDGGETATSRATVTLYEPAGDGLEEARDVRSVTIDWRRAETWAVATIAVSDAESAQK